MKKLIKSLREHQAPGEFTRADWTAAALGMFGPYFRRKSRLEQNISSFHLELWNLARILRHPEYLDLLSWCLRLHRQVLKKDRQGAYNNLLKLMGNIQSSDDRWLNMFETSTPLEADAGLHDRSYQLLTTIDGVAEGCFKPQLQLLFASAQRNVMGSWPTDVASMDFGALVGAFPRSLRAEAKLLLHDPDLGIPINQWRNIAAHKSFRLVGPQTIEVTYGRGTIHAQRLGFYRLRKVWHWILRSHTAARLANTIIYIEHMREINAIAPPLLDLRLSSTLMHISHDMSTVGFETIRWLTTGRDGILVLRDALSRPLRDALIHASQMLDQLSVGILLDPTTRNRLDRAGIALETTDGTRLGTALIQVRIAESFTLRKINLKAYLSNIEWIL